MEFPILISGELAQSGAILSTSALHIEHFFEGYARQSQQLADYDQRIWQLRYSNLQPAEAMKLRNFYEALPIDGVFTFTDPWSGQTYTTCRLAPAPLTLSCDQDNRFTAYLEIENAG